MKTQIAIWSMCAGYVGFSALQEGAIQFWLVALAPVLIVGVAFALLVSDRGKVRNPTLRRYWSAGD